MPARRPKRPTPPPQDEPQATEILSTLRGALEGAHVRTVAEDANRTHNCVYLIARGATRPSLDTAAALARVLGYDLQLVERPEPEGAPA